MARTKMTPRKLAPGLVGNNAILAPAAQGPMQHSGAAPVAQLGIGVTGAVPHLPHSLNKKQKRHHIFTEAAYDDKTGKFLDWKDFPARLDESKGTKYEVVFSRKMKCTLMIDDGSDDDDDPPKPTKSGDELRAMAVQLGKEIKRKFQRGEYYTDSNENEVSVVGFVTSPESG